MFDTKPKSSSMERKKKRETRRRSFRVIKRRRKNWGRRTKKAETKGRVEAKKQK